MTKLLIIVLGAVLLVGCGGSKAVAPTPTSPPAPTKEPQAAFSQTDIVRLATQQIGALPVGSLPPGARSVRCKTAEFRPANRMWVVACDFFTETTDTVKTDTAPMQTSTYTLNDADGKLVK